MAISKLLGCDPSEVSPAQAGAHFSAEAKRLAAVNDWDLTKAWTVAKSLHPDVHARMCEGSQTAAAIANEAPRQPARARITEISREYTGLFKQAMERSNGDPVKAHSLVMRTLRPPAAALANSAEAPTVPAKASPAVAPVALSNSADTMQGPIALCGPTCEPIDSTW